MVVALTVYAHYIYEGSIINKILKIILLNINFLLISGIIVLILGSRSFYVVTLNPQTVYYNIAAFIKIVYIIEYVYLKKYYTGEFELPKYVWFFIIFVLVSLIGLVVIVTNELLCGDVALDVALYTYIVSLMVVVLIYYVCLKLTDYYHKLLDQKIYLESLKYEETIIEVANQKSEEYNKILHDYKNLVGILRDSEVSDETKQEILSHIELDSQRELIHSNNSVFNYAMNKAMAKADKLGIDFHGVYPCHIPEGISGYDMAKLLTNLFDNAIEASKEANTKEIVYKIECNEYNFIVRIKNTYNESQFNDFKTTKHDEKKHGLGMNIIKDVVEKYNGEDAVLIQENMVLHSCLINLKK
ncbi:sensor histidine kinase [[Clostridium] spiroforme]|nr:sensor histidine kinase [Thomasclavelia spiroformis]